MVLVLVVASLIYVACDTKKPTSVQSEDGTIAVLNKATPYTIETIKPELKKLLAYLKRNPQIITPAVLTKAAERHATIKDIGLEAKFPLEFPLDNGNTLEVYIELYDGSVGSGTSVEDAEVYLSLDIDRYTEEAAFANDKYSFQAEVAATSHNKRKGLYKDEQSQRQLAINSQPRPVDYLWFLVGGEERLSQANEQHIYQQWLNSRPGIAKAQQAADTEYWWLTKINVIVDKDGGSDDEFEMYYGPTGNAGSNDPFEYATIFVFDGQWRGDKSGTARLYPDINGTSTYTPSHPIAVEILTPDSPAGFKICAIEDDCSKAVHKNDHHGGGFHHAYLNVYDMDNNSYSLNQYWFWILDDCADDDDIYGGSGTVSFGNGPTCTKSEPTGWDIRVCLRKGTVAQADNNWGGEGCGACNF